MVQRVDSARLEQLIKGQTPRSQWVDVKAVGTECQIRVETETMYSSDLPSCVGIEDLFEEVNCGAQSGCGPIFLNTNQDVLESRIKKLFQEKLDELVDEIFEDVRGGRAKAHQLVRERFKALSACNAKFSETAIRPILAHFPHKVTPKKRGYCYYDARLWLFPRTARVAPDVRTVWDCKPKLVFRDMYDPGDKEIIAAIDTSGMVIDNHLFNGGVYVASVKKPDGRTNLSRKGVKLRGKFSSDEEFLGYLGAVLNSHQVQEWGHANPLERVQIPMDTDLRIARRMAAIETAKNPPWGRQSEPTVVERQAEKITDLFESRLKDFGKRPDSATVRDTLILQVSKATLL